ncbi:hypothetical protein AB0F72_09290 [Actinoplanes sp. NPDC023936]|uniref:hypothetical protein n=1 Tax=Actinoplanes sp. NPDC023936 TaxID=3154910 RepID=UPI0033CEA2BF
MTDLNLTAVQHWSEHTYAWIDDNAPADTLPDFVVRHFVEHVPALVVRIQHLTAELAAASQMLDVLTAEETR